MAPNRRATRWCVTASAILCSSWLAEQTAAAQFRAFGSVRSPTGTVFDEYDVSGAIQAGGEASLVGGNLQANSLADIAGLRAHSFADQAGSGATSLASAVATYENIVVTGPPGPVQTSLRLHLGGNMTVGSVLGTFATSLVTVYVKVNGAVIVGSNDSLLFDARSDDPVLVFANGALTDWRPPEGTITTPAFTVQAGVPFSLELQLHTDAGASGEPATANADFGNTLSFVSIDPVFDLPGAYSVEGPDAGIEDNRFVPEPATPVLTALALLVQYACARNRGTAPRRRGSYGASSSSRTRRRSTSVA